MTTEFSNLGAMRVISAAGVRGAGGIARRGFSVSDQATMFGIATLRRSRTFGGVTMVCS